jgi:hypothetical protein
LGLTLVECAQGAFPYHATHANNNNSNNNTSIDTNNHGLPVNNSGQQRSSQQLGFWELLDVIVKEAPPQLPLKRDPEDSAGFSPEFCDFIHQW